MQIRSGVGWAMGLVAVLGGCAIARPYQETKSASGLCKGDAIVSVTEATVKPDAASREIFWRNIRAINASLPNQKGLIGYSMRQKPLGDTAWTMTLWADETALVSFVYSGRHDTAMQEARDATASMKFVRFRRPCELGPPSWDEALTKLAETGRSY